MSHFPLLLKKGPVQLAFETISSEFNFLWGRNFYELSFKNMHLLHWMECNTITFCSLSLCFLSLVPAAEERFEKDSKIPERTLLRACFSFQALISAGSSSPPLLVSRLFPEHGAGHRLLPQSARHELPGVPHVLLLLVFIVVPVSEPRVRPAAHAGPRRPETALPRRQAPQGHQRAGGDGADLRQSQFSSEANRLEPDSRPCAVLSGLSSSDLCLLVYRPQTSSCLL